MLSGSTFGFGYDLLSDLSDQSQYLLCLCLSLSFVLVCEFKGASGELEGSIYVNH